jgi:hypothetical protein
MSAEAFVSRAKAIAHWRRVLETPDLPAISYAYAKAALDVLETTSRTPREPGGDDES